MKKILLLISTGALLAGCATNQDANSGAVGPAATTGYAQGTGSSFQGDSDAQFIRAAAQWTVDDTEMGRLIAQNARTQGAKDLGERLIKDNSDARNELTEIAARKGITLPTEKSEQATRVVERLEDLRGERFEQNAAHDAIDSSQRELRMYQRLGVNVQDPELWAFEQKYQGLLRYHLLMAQDL